MRDFSLTARQALHRAGRVPALLVQTGRRPLALGALLLVASATTALATQNTPPEITSATISPNTLNEGQQAVLTLRFTDANPGDYHTIRVKWHDGLSLPTEVHQLPAGQTSISLPHTFKDDGPLVNFGSKVQVTLYDRQTPPGDTNDNTTGAGQDVAFIPVTVKNVAPTIPPPTTSAQQVGIRFAVTIAGSIVDPGADKHEVKVAKWYGSKPSNVYTPCTVTEGRFQCDLTYPVPVEPVEELVTLMVKDDEGAEGTTTVAVLLAPGDPSSVAPRPKPKPGSQAPRPATKR